MEPKEARRCKCGHDKGHPMVSPAGEYTTLGWVMILMGISARPTGVRFVCRRCEAVIERATDKKTIAETRLWG